MDCEIKIWRHPQRSENVPWSRDRQVAMQKLFLVAESGGKTLYSNLPPLPVSF
jgi:hypothetical protein